MITRNSLQEMIENCQDKGKIIGRALLVVFRNQTNDEQNQNITRIHNNKGFTPADAHSGCIHAKYFLKHGTLADWMIEKWMKKNEKGIMRIAKYHAQVDVAAKEKSRML